MPKINRRATTYVKLDEDSQTKNIKEAKLEVSLNMLVPPDWEKKGMKFLEKANDKLKKMFKEFIEEMED